MGQGRASSNKAGQSKAAPGEAKQQGITNLRHRSADCRIGAGKQVQECLMTLKHTEHANLERQTKPNNQLRHTEQQQHSTKQLGVRYHNMQIKHVGNSCCPRKVESVYLLIIYYLLNIHFYQTTHDCKIRSLKSDLTE